MEIIQRFGLFPKLFSIWQNSKNVCQYLSSVILKSKCKLEKYNLIYLTSTQKLFYVHELCKPFRLPLFPPKEQGINKLKTLKMLEGVSFTVLNVDTWKISSLKKYSLLLSR